MLNFLKILFTGVRSSKMEGNSIEMLVPNLSERFKTRDHGKLSELSYDPNFEHNERINDKRVHFLDQATVYLSQRLQEQTGMPADECARALCQNRFNMTKAESQLQKNINWSTHNVRGEIF